MNDDSISHFEISAALLVMLNKVRISQASVFNLELNLNFTNLKLYSLVSTVGHIF